MYLLGLASALALNRSPVVADAVAHERALTADTAGVRASNGISSSIAAYDKVLGIPKCSSDGT